MSSWHMIGWLDLFQWGVSGEGDNSNPFYWGEFPIIETIFNQNREQVLPILKCSTEYCYPLLACVASSAVIWAEIIWAQGLATF